MRPGLIALLFLLASSEASFAADGVTINHAKALAGGVTTADAPGYPVTLSQPGKYVLVGNLAVPSGRDGIDASGVDVTIDLNGFRIEGSNVAANGIVGKNRNLTVRNGTVQRFALYGITVPGFGSIIEDMRVSENGLDGIAGGGKYIRIIDSTILNNRSQGINCYTVCHIEGNYIANNTGYGVVTSGGTVLGNTIQDNKIAGIAKNSGSILGIGNNTISGSPLMVEIGFGATGTVIQLHPNACSSPC